MRQSDATRVLFVCIHNSARSQMAEAFLNRLGGGRFEAESAGLEPGRLNPAVVQAMAEVGIDISRNATKSVEALLREGRRYDVVVTVCDGANAERCPIFPGAGERLHWPFNDPGAVARTQALDVARSVRDAIRERVEEWTAGPDAGPPPGHGLRAAARTHGDHRTCPNGQ